MTQVGSFDAAYCEALAQRVIEGDVAAWKDLVSHVWPHLVRRASAGAAPHARCTDDDERNIATTVLDKLCRNDHRGLRQYFDWKRQQCGKSFQDWLFIVRANAARDQARSGKSRQKDPEGAGQPSVKRFLNEVATSGVLEQLGVRPPVTTQQTARQVLELARNRLAPLPYSALELWLQGHEHSETAEALGLPDEDSARQLVRAAIAVLRRAFLSTKD